MKAAVCAAVALAAVLSVGARAEASLIVNGSFESGSGAGGGSYATLNAGSTDITGWNVVGGSIDWIGGYWQAQEGTRSVDLNGNAAGGVSQTFATTAGTMYRVDFWLAGNPDGSPATKTVKVDSGTTNANFQFATVLAAGTRSNMNWTPYQFDFVAGSASTTLSFLSQDNGFYGGALDNVSVNAVPEPGLLALLGAAVLPVLRRRR